MKEPIELLLRIFVNGGRVKDGGYEFAMADDGNLCSIAYNDKGEEVYLAYDCDLRGLKQMAESIGRHELWLNCCALQLTKIKQEGYV